jgi:hypothetical protein
VALAIIIVAMANTTPNPTEYPLDVTVDGRTYRYRIAPERFWGVELIFERARGGWAHCRNVDRVIAVRNAHRAMTVEAA